MFRNLCSPVEEVSKNFLCKLLLATTGDIEAIFTIFVADVNKGASKRKMIIVLSLVVNKKVALGFVFKVITDDLEISGDSILIRSLYRIKNKLVQVNCLKQQWNYLLVMLPIELL